MIRDQRFMLGLETHESVEQVEAFWQRWGETQGFRARVAGEVHNDLRRSRKKLDAYVSDSRWVADCPECNGGVACWHENPHGCCLDCGTVFSIRFPDEREGIERVLLARTDQATRNYLPGETLADLKAENLVRGVPLERPVSED